MNRRGKILWPLPVAILSGIVSFSLMAQTSAGQPAQVTVGVVNQEGVAASYQIEITIDGVKNGAFGPFVLQNGEKREQTVSITPTKAGDDQKVALFVYRDQGKDPYLQPLRLSVNVR